MIATFIFAGFSHPQTTYAQCTSNDDSGNLYGYADTENFGRIYMSRTSWNDFEATQTTQPFSVSYNRQNDTWSGRGWNEIMGWVDFGETNSDNISLRRAEFESALANPGDYGNLVPQIYLGDENIVLQTGETISVAGVAYSTNSGSFVGSGWNGDYTIANVGNGDDVAVGAGEITFANVSLVESPCQEYVDLLVNGEETYYQETCPITNPTLTWNTTNVNNCVIGSDNWSSPQGTSIGTSGSQNANVSVNPSETFSLNCTGTQSGNTIQGIAIAVCGPTTGGGDDPVVDNVVAPDFKEV